MPFRYPLWQGESYTGIDVHATDDFGMMRSAEIFYFDGRTIPFPDESFDELLCPEVLKHVEDPMALNAEINRVLRPGGSLVATAPFAHASTMRPITIIAIRRSGWRRCLAASARGRSRSAATNLR